MIIVREVSDTVINAFVAVVVVVVVLELANGHSIVSLLSVVYRRVENREIACS